MYNRTTTKTKTLRQWRTGAADAIEALLRRRITYKKMDGYARAAALEIAELPAPDGYVLVPRVPTPAMVEAACAASCERGTPWESPSWDGDGGVSRDGVRRNLKAAYCAAVLAWQLLGED